MRQITKITLALGLIFILASCQSSQSGCYDFGEVNPTVTERNSDAGPSDLIFISKQCRP